MTHEYVLDTETTGLKVGEGHRLVEIACIEMKNRERTGQVFHYYINPEREIDQAAEKVHGITIDFLKDKPKFSEVCKQFLAFIESGNLIIHNASFDMGFLDAEYAKVGIKNWFSDQRKVVDTLEIARRKYPGQRNNLDALCKRLGVDNSGRKLHGALLDVELLIDVYLNLTSEQSGFLLDSTNKMQKSINEQAKAFDLPTDNIPVIHANIRELELHKAMLELLAKSNAER